MDTQKYGELSRTIIDALRRFKLSHREQNLATVICQESLGNGRDSVAVPELQIFGDLTGYSPNNICTTLKHLEMMRVIRVSDATGMPQYSINIETDSWQVAPRVVLEQVKRAKDSIRRFNS